MTKHSFTVTLLILFTATLILPSSGFARQAQQGSKPDASAQSEQCYLRVEIANPKAKKDVSNNEVSCNKITWGPTAATVNGALSKKECLDDRARIGNVKVQRDSKAGQSSKTCFVQQYARADLSGSNNQQNQQNRQNQQNQNQQK